MKSITILKSTEKQHELTISEKKELFSSIQAQTNLPQYYFDAFISHAEYKDPYDISVSKFLNLELKAILNWVSPILNEIPCRKRSQPTFNRHKKSAYSRRLFNWLVTY